MHLTLAWIFVSLCYATVRSQGCVNIGDKTQGSKYDAGANNTIQFMSDGHEIGVDCHGIITEWTLYHGDINKCNDMTMQIWRPDVANPGLYTLAARHHIPIVAQGLGGCGGFPNAPAEITISIPEGERLQVQSGDVIGWLDSINPSNRRNRFISFEEGLTGSNQYDRVLTRTTSCTSIGGQCPWVDGQAGVALYARRYSLQATIIDQTTLPVITNLPVTVKIEEHGTVFPLDIFTVQAENNWMWEQGSVPPALKYSIIDGGDGLFVIDESTGIVTNIEELDYETKDQYILEINVCDGPLCVDSTVTVDVVDINEPHTIDWPDNPVFVTVDASTTDTADVLIGDVIKYIDGDSETAAAGWGDKTWFIIRQDPTVDLFKIEPDVSGTTGLKFAGQIKTTRSLEHWDGTDTVSLYIYCTDGTHTAGPEIMEIFITNIRQPPFLKNLPAVITLPEGIPPVYQIFTVTSEIDQRGVSAVYDIIGVYPEIEKDMFTIDAGSGSISANTQFDYLLHRTFEIEIIVKENIVTDSGKTLTSVAANLTVDITWVNQPPYYNDTSQTWSATVYELEPIGTELYMVNLDGWDRDISLGRDWIDYTITSVNGEGEHLFRADNITRKVYVDREIRLPDGVDKKTYNLEVHVHDSNGEHGNKPLEVTVIGRNLHKPEFSEKSYYGEVAETAPGGTLIVTIAVTDYDGGDNGYLDFSILEEPAKSYFQISGTKDPSTTGVWQGEVLSIQPFNYSAVSSFTFTVIAADRGFPISYSDTTTVTVNITEENTHPPVFVDDFYNTEIPTSAGSGYMVTTLSVVDPDSDAVGTTTFDLLVPDDDFSVGHSSGVVYQQASSLPPYQKYLLYVYAKDILPNGDTLYMSAPSVVRIDTYKASSQLVDIHLKMSLEEFTLVQDDFMETLHSVLTPNWILRIQNIRLNADETIITIYAIRDGSAETINDIENQKKFVHRNEILSILSRNVQGHPKNVLLGPDFADFKPVRVLPTHPIWLIETVEGIITLTLLCLLAAAALVALFVYCAKRHQILCFQKRKWVAPSQEPPPATEPEFDLGYKTEKSKKIPPVFTVPYKHDYSGNAVNDSNKYEMYDLKFKPGERNYTKPTNPGYTPSMIYPSSRSSSFIDAKNKLLDGKMPPVNDPEKPV